MSLLAYVNTAKSFKTTTTPGGAECSGSLNLSFPVVWSAFLVYWWINAAGAKTTQRSVPVLLGILRLSPSWS